MHRDQTVFDMVEEILERQARSLVAQTGLTFREAMEAVEATGAGRQLRELADGEFRDRRASEWQASLLRKRVEERRYSWVEGYTEWLDAKEARAPYDASLEEFASLSG